MDIVGLAAEIINFIRDRGGADRKQVARYIDAIAADVEEAAKLWAETIARTKSGTQLAAGQEVQRTMHCLPIDGHYLKATTTIDGRLGTELREKLFNGLGGYLKDRIELEDLQRTSVDPAALARMDGQAKSLLQYAADLRALALEINCKH